MPSERRERERAQRHQRIIDAAREIAEAEGWDSVTTRRLAERVEYSQPVLYSHFNGKDAIVSAVALDGFGELATQLTAATALRAVCDAYLDFASRRPALYQAMFSLPTDLRFASDETPAVLRACFNAFVKCFPPDDQRRELLAEVVWSALHGIALLSATGRIPAGGQAERVDLLVERFGR